MNKTASIVAGLIVIAIIIVGGWYFFATPVSQPALDSTGHIPSGDTTQSVGSGDTGAKTYTLADVALHKDGTSCWVAINGKVYDVTKWIPQHPGGPNRILSICGIDGSTAFNGQHEGDRRPASELAGFYIGDLVSAVQ